MADETPLDMDKIAEIDDPKALEAEIARRAGTPAEPAKPAEPVTVVVEPEAVKPAEEPKPAAEAKPAEEAKTAAEAKPAESSEPKPTADNAWKRVRLLEKEIKELREASKPKPDTTLDTPKAPTYEDDPAEFLKARTGQLEAEVERLKDQKAFDDKLGGIKAREADFERQHPDYRSALLFLENSAVREWQKTGLEKRYVRTLNERLAAGRRGDQAFAGYVTVIDTMMEDPGVRQFAEKEGRDLEDAAVWLASRNDYLNARRQEIWVGAEETGRSEAEIAYETAQDRGYKPPALAEPAKPSAEGSADAARARVLRQQQISEATNSLSESASAEGGPQRRVLRNRNEVLNLDEASLDALIESKEYRNL